MLPQVIEFAKSLGINGDLPWAEPVSYQANLAKSAQQLTRWLDGDSEAITSLTPDNIWDVCDNWCTTSDGEELSEMQMTVIRAVHLAVLSEFPCYLNRGDGGERSVMHMFNATLQLNYGSTKLAIQIVKRYRIAYGAFIRAIGGNENHDTQYVLTCVAEQAMRIHERIQWQALEIVEQLNILRSLDDVIVMDDKDLLIWTTSLMSLRLGQASSIIASMVHAGRNT
jgi:hypothetical protein